MAASRMIYDGSTLKVKLSIACCDFDMHDADADFSAKVFNDVHEQTIAKEDMVETDDGYLFMIDTSEFGPGTYYMETTAHVHDTDFDRERTEIDRQKLCIVDQ